MDSPTANNHIGGATYSTWVRDPMRNINEEYYWGGMGNPATYWSRFKSGHENNTTTKTVIEYLGPFSTGAGTVMHYFNDRDFAGQHGNISKIIIHAWGLFEGIEIFYRTDRTTSGLRGIKGGSSREMDVDSGEFSTRAYGADNALYVNKITIYKTRKDGNGAKGISGGGGGNASYKAGPDIWNFNRHEKFELQDLNIWPGIPGTHKVLVRAGERYGKDAARLLWISGWHSNPDIRNGFT